jgi:hypothetical protein
MNAVWTIDFMRDTLYSGKVFRTMNVLDGANLGTCSHSGTLESSSSRRR